MENRHEIGLTQGDHVRIGDESATGQLSEKEVVLT
jgi:hypothetical protein